MIVIIIINNIRVGVEDDCPELNEDVSELIIPIIY